MSRRLSAKEAQEMASFIAKEYKQNPVKVKFEKDDKIWKIFRSGNHKFLFFKWRKWKKESYVHAAHLEDLIDEFVQKLERDKAYVDPRWDHADNLRRKYLDKLLDEKLKT